MARTFNTSSNYLELSAPFAMPLKGTIVVWFKPTWDSWDGNWHTIYHFDHAQTPLIFWKTNALYLIESLAPSQFFWNGVRHYSDTAIDYAVLENARQGFSAHCNLFNAGEGAVWMHSWDYERGDSWCFKNHFAFGGLMGRGGFHIPFSPPTFTKIRIGGDGTQTANGDLAEFAIFDYQLSDVQRLNMMWTGIAGVSPPPIYYNKILGDKSPEPAVIGAPLTVVGSCPKAPHPIGFNPMGDRPPPAAITVASKPPLGSLPNMAHSLSDGLIWAMPFNEGSGHPRETVSNTLPDAVEKPAGYPDWVWEADGSLHFKNLNIPRWNSTTAFDGLEAFTLCFLTTVDLYASPSGPTFPFPNGGVGTWISKQFIDGFRYGDGSQSVFQIGYQQGDEIQGSLGGHFLNPGDQGYHFGPMTGGRWDVWCFTGRGEGPPDVSGFPDLVGIDTFYDFQLTRLPLTDHYVQMFLIYDIHAPEGRRWKCRVNGVEQYPSDVFVDAPEPLPVTIAPVQIGGGWVSPYQNSGGHTGKYQYFYIWEGVRPDVWKPLLDYPYAFFAFNGGPMSQGNLDSATCDTIAGWAWDPSLPNNSINVDILADGQFLARLPADVFRQDLLNAGIGNGQHGFSLLLPESLKNGQTHSIVARVTGRNINLYSTPKSILCAGTGGPINGGPSSYGNLEVADCSVIAGWAWDPFFPNTPISVDVVADGQVIATIAANQFRQDLLNAGIGNGWHAFSFSVPQSLKNGQVHSIMARVTGRNINLYNMPRSILCGVSGGVINGGPSSYGNLEVANCSVISGWAWDPGFPNTPINVDVLAHGQVVATIAANQFRQDLLNAGIGNGQHAFSFLVPQSLKNGQVHSIMARVTGRTINLSSMPKSILCGVSGGVINGGPSSYGNLEVANCSVISGWAWDPFFPNTPINVDVLADGQVVATIVANQFRQDLLNARIGNGQHAFSFLVPQSLKNGQVHSIMARVTGRNINLSNMPKSILCGG